MSIPMPSKSEKEQSIHFILEQGVPKKESFLSALIGLIKKIGLKNLFWGLESYIFLSCISAIAFVIVFMLPMNHIYNFRTIGLFLVSPFFYFMLHGMTVWKEMENQTYEIKMTCHYTLREITAIRMVFFGGFATVLDVFFTSVVCRLPGNSMDILQLVGISLSALFLYGTATMVFLTRGWSFYKQFLVPVIWSISCLLPLLFKIDMEAVLLQIPKAVVVMIVIVSACSYVWQIKRYLFQQNKGGESYAIG